MKRLQRHVAQKAHKNLLQGGIAIQEVVEAANQQRNLIMWKDFNNLVVQGATSRCNDQQI